MFFVLSSRHDDTSFVRHAFASPETIPITIKTKIAMKKILMLATGVAMTAMTIVSCDGGAEKNLKDNVDSIAYDLGVFQSEGLKRDLMQIGLDSTTIDEFLKGMEKGALNELDPKKKAYMIGIEVGENYVKQNQKGLTQEIYGDDSTKTINIKAMLAGYRDGLKGTAKVTAEEAYIDFQQRLSPFQEEKLMKQFGDNKIAGEKYLAANAKKEGVKVTPSGLQYKVLVEGTGALPTDSAQLQVNYEGRLIDGTVFDSSYERNTPLTVNMAQPSVIPGWIEVLKMMPAGSKWEVTIPQELAYGKQNNGRIQPFSTLIFTIEVLK